MKKIQDTKTKTTNTKLAAQQLEVVRGGTDRSYVSGNFFATAK